MKKFLSIIVILFALTCFEVNSFALTDQLPASGNMPVQSLNEVKFISGEIQDEIQIMVKNYNGYAVTRLASPDRIVIDIPNVSVSAAKQLAAAKSVRVKAVRFASFGNNSARIVIDTADVQKYRICEKDGRLSVYVIDSIADNITYLNTGDEANLDISGAAIIQSGRGGEEPYTEKYEPESGRHILTFYSGAVKIPDKTVKINDSLMDSMQFVNNIYTKQISIVFTAKQRLSFKVSLKGDTKGTEINISKFKDANGPEGGGKDKADRENRELSSLSVEYARNDGADAVSILTDNYSGYNIMRLSSPDRIVIDIPYAAAPESQQSIEVESDLVKAVRYAQFESSVGRVVLDTVGQPQYQVEEKEGRLIVSVQAPEYKNIAYSAAGDRVCFILPGIHLTEGGQDLKKFYSESYDETGMKYTVTFPSSLGDIGSGTFKVNGSLIEYVDIVKNDDDGTTGITFTAKEQVVYNIITRKTSAVDDTTITVLKPFSLEDRLIVIDPGHGGSDPGAVHGDLMEKSLNIDIAKRLNTMLKSKGINTYMTRDDDTYIGLYERSYIANKLNATLFLSIHNNAYKVSAKGTETLYFPSKTGFGKRFAQIIQDSLTSNLGTFDRKIKARPEIVVLKATSMPSALAEIAFITNPDDAQKLKSDEFIQKAAEALCEAVVKALEEVP
ncbi:N-acetylmuramoyl-L-alanine amidase [Anaerobacterium chartisolvens]|uniref:N-acetylmuramoyl-L-alanine amidase n=1 Tax=Anaerobacterium chartisolvens TaxID=1297424 RepID=A0A369B7J9_9FIRM|nr:N-acetylmuramoyl-L-alanine amidase [Anaerobacterium chartisolvens]RCX17502.1 N-acetylmuramoyl-L-alanine amidase [Anaerobacterium chartisolvens]